MTRPLRIGTSVTFLTQRPESASSPSLVLREWLITLEIRINLVGTVRKSDTNFELDLRCRLTTESVFRCLCE